MVNKYCYEYPRPSVTADVVIFGYDQTEIKVLLIERGIEPFKGKHALPGGFVHEDETTEECAKRELFEETGLENIFTEQLYTFSDIYRDPRGKVITVAYFALINMNETSIKAGDDAQNAEWFSLNKIPALAFDHDMIFRKALYRLKSKIRWQPIGFELLPEKFTLGELQNLYESILEINLDKRNFRKKILKTELLIQTEEKQQNVAHKPATFYKFDKKRYTQLEKDGFNFEI
jgi:8-oxo-dGTP diphosphatase